MIRLSLPRDRIRRRRMRAKLTNISLMCVLSVATAWVVTRSTDGTGFNPPAALRQALLVRTDPQPSPASRRGQPEKVGAAAIDEPANRFGYKLRPGPYAVAEVSDFILHDASREKELHIRIFYPVASGKFPVIVFSHGAGGSQNCCEELTRHWASYGYITIQPTHADSALQRRSAGDENVRFAQAVREALQRPALWEERPLDVSAVIDALADIAKRVPVLTGKIDSQRIGVGGHSMGSFTAEAIAGALVAFPGKPATSFADPRAKAILCLSPQGPGQFGLTDKSFQSLTIPYLGITGSEDNLGMLATSSWHKLPFELSPHGNKYHLFIAGANHMSFISSHTQLPSNSDRGEAILRYTNSAALAFWDAYLKTDGNAKKYLRSDALTIFSKGAAKLDED
jgi:predicted dienelactone hydrolase